MKRCKALAKHFLRKGVSSSGASKPMHWFFETANKACVDTVGTCVSEIAHRQTLLDRLAKTAIRKKAHRYITLQGSAIFVN